MLHLLADRCRHPLGVALRHASLGERAQVLGWRHTVRHRFLRVFVFQFRKRERAGRGHPQGFFQPVRRIDTREREQGAQMALPVGFERMAALGHRHAQPGGREHVLQGFAAARVHQHTAGSYYRQPGIGGNGFHRLPVGAVVGAGGQAGGDPEAPGKPGGQGECVGGEAGDALCLIHRAGQRGMRRHPHRQVRHIQAGATRHAGCQVGAREGI